MKFRSLATIALLSALGLAACGSDAASPAVKAPISTTAGDAPATSGAFNNADVAFAQGMIPHHEQAIEMADVALDPTVKAGEKVVDLARRIKAGQDPEIALMTDWLTTWGQPIQVDMSAMDMSAMDGMMSVDEMDSLGKMNAAEFDKMWMTMMTRHHEGAIAMAETVKTASSNAEVLTLADAVISAQKSEIAEMKDLLGG